MYCSSCGSPLSSGEQICPTCGAHTPNSYANSGISSSDPTVISSPYDNGQRSSGEHAMPGLLPGGMGGNTPPTDYGPYAPTPQYPSSGQQNPFTPVPPYSYVPPPPPQSPYNAQMAEPRIPYSPTPVLTNQQGKKQPRRRMGVFIALLLILLVLLLGSFGIVYYTGVSRSNAMHIQATATASSQATETARVQAQATVDARATAAVINPYTSSGVLVFADPLQDNSKGHRWDENGNCAFKSGAYYVLAPSPNYGDYCTSQATDVTNFAFEVQMKILQGDGGGIDFRSDNAGGTNQYYDFYVFQDGSYELDMVKGSTAKVLTSGSSVAIKQGLNQTNLLAAVVEGTKISVYVNNQQVSSVSDSTYSHGQIGVEANPFATGGHQTNVEYSNAKVWKL